ncbi:MAG: hypothetical protein L0332_07600 [Chloroflexi bacterium]|nr:hypothetical protein [Chloroflexota bacterium]MCI0726573.1 hypothetical protein [Chloroflexota bacterium]
MNQPQTQTREYWGPDFSISDSDIEQIYNGFLEAEKPQTIEQISRLVVAHRVAEERNRIKQRLTGRQVYRPKNSYQVGDELVFPALKFANGRVTAARPGYDPQRGHFTVLAVEINGKAREFAAELPGEHVLNEENGAVLDPLADVDLEELYKVYGPLVAKKLAAALAKRDEFIRLGNLWFIKPLMAEVNVGHLHLAEAVLEMNEGGPLPTLEIMPHLDMDESLDSEVRRFSLDYALLQDDRFDEVAPPGRVAWFLRRLEPEGVVKVPERLQYTPIPYDRALLNPQLLLLERELDDEWSELEPAETPLPTILSLIYPHRWAGTLPLSSRTRPLFPTGISARQRILLVDEETQQEIVAWVVQEHRHVFGLADWYRENSIPVGGFITLKPGPGVGVVYLNYDRRRPQREWVRLASVEDNHIKFELERRSVGCGYDDLLIVGTDYVTALDVLARRIESTRRSLASLLVEIFPQLAALNPQRTVHAKTLYSAVNMLRRVPPGPLFAELVKHQAFHPVGDHYWQYEK